MSPYCTTLHQPLDSSKNRGGRPSRAAGFENLIRIAYRNRNLNGAACLLVSFVSFIRESDSGIPSVNEAEGFIGFHTNLFLEKSLKRMLDENRPSGYHNCLEDISKFCS
jgi:hypothetical protein